MTTTQSLQLFLRALQGQNFSPKTLRAYGDDLTQFLKDTVGQPPSVTLPALLR